MSDFRLIARVGVPALLTGVIAVAGVMVGPTGAVQAARVDGGKGPQLLIGRDDHRTENPAIQAGAAENQSLNRTDIIEGGRATT